jgi:uncharacterized protein (TIGR01777 family)
MLIGPMKVLVSGSSGLVGSALVRKLQANGSDVGRLVRTTRATSPLDVCWQPGELLDPELVADFDAVVHLAGRNLAGRWNDQMKREIRESRLLGTATISRAVAAAFRACSRPSVLVSASAIGYYGSRGCELLTESSASGTGFLAELCREWEAAAGPAAEAGVRLVLPRLGVVLSGEGGALARLLPIFRRGFGGRVGNGRQYWSWITLEDVVASIEFAIATPSLSGPVNLTSPNPVTNAGFTAALARALRRPAVFPVPAFALRLVLGEMADEALLASQRVQPEKLLKAGFPFAHPQLDEALAQICGRRG